MSFVQCSSCSGFLPPGCNYVIVTRETDGQKFLLCLECGEIYISLSELGQPVIPEGNMQDAIVDYLRTTGKSFVIVTQQQ